MKEKRIVGVYVKRRELDRTLQELRQVMKRKEKGIKIIIEGEREKILMPGQEKKMGKIEEKRKEDERELKKDKNSQVKRINREKRLLVE